MTSIRRKLLISLLVGLIGSTALTTAVAYFGAVTELHELFTDNLRRIAVVLKSQAFSASRATPSDLDTSELEESHVIQIWDQKGALLQSSRPDLQMPLRLHDGLSRAEIDGRTWEIYTLKAGDQGYVQISQPQEIVASMVGESAVYALLPFLSLFALVACGGWIAVGHSLKPLTRLSQKISEWRLDRMAPLEVTDVPHEIQPIVHSLNSMQMRLDRAMSMQQEFTADSAHELRTPLTAIRLQLDNLMRAGSEQERREAIENLSCGVDRCIHLSSQLLAASRSMALMAHREMKDVRLEELVRSAIASFAVVASAKKVELSFDGDVDLFIVGDEEGLRILTNNLVDNAIRYTPSPGQVAVSLMNHGDLVVLEVSDNGPGIPVEEHEKIFRRFYRMPGTASTGSGLGLSIVRNIAEIHNASVSISGRAPELGTIVKVVFPTTGIIIRRRLCPAPDLVSRH